MEIILFLIVAFALGYIIDNAITTVGKDGQEKKNRENNKDKK